MIRPLLTSAGKREAAIASYREALTLRPADGDAMNNLALLLAEDEATVAEAGKWIDTALARSPDDPYYVATKGEVQYRAGRPEEALETFQRALDLLPATDEAARRHVMKWMLRAE